MSEAQIYHQIYQSVIQITMLIPPGLKQRFSKYGPLTICRSIIWELVLALD